VSFKNELSCPITAASANWSQAERVSAATVVAGLLPAGLATTAAAAVEEAAVVGVPAAVEHHFGGIVQAAAVVWQKCLEDSEQEEQMPAGIAAAAAAETAAFQFVAVPTCVAAVEDFFASLEFAISNHSAGADALPVVLEEKNVRFVGVVVPVLALLYCYDPLEALLQRSAAVVDRQTRPQRGFYHTKKDEEVPPVQSHRRQVKDP